VTLAVFDIFITNAQLAKRVIDAVLEKRDLEIKGSDEYSEFGKKGKEKRKRLVVVYLIPIAAIFNSLLYVK